MKNIFAAIFLLLIPFFAYAETDISGCEVIGYQTSHISEKNCMTKEKCEESFLMHNEQSKLDDCMQHIQTAQECENYINEQQNLARKKFLIYKCPVTDDLLQRKNANKDVGGLEKNAYYNDDTPIDTAAMISDNKNVYIFVNTPLAGLGAISETSKLRHYIIGPKGDDELMFTWL